MKWSISTGWEGDPSLWRVEEGAIVKFGERYFVVSVSTARFECDGESFMGISPQAPIYQAMEGKRSGETFVYGGRQFDIQALF